MIVLYLMAKALALDCNLLLQEQMPFVQARARRFIRDAPYIGRRLGMGADDVAQELLLALMRSIPEIDETRSHDEQIAFLNQRMQWRLQDLSRRSMAKLKALNELTEETEPVAEERRDPVQDEEMLEHVRTKLGFLKKKDRVYMQMAIDGASPEDISDRTGIGLVRVKISLQTSRKILRDVFGRLE